MNTYTWYQALIKPTWAPPSWLFGPVWSVLYMLIFISFGTVFYKVFTRELSWAIGLPFLLNIFFNVIFTPIQFGLRNNLLASVDILLILVTLLWALFVVYTKAPELRWIAYINIPYALWVMFATVLQISITYLNR